MGTKDYQNETEKSGPNSPLVTSEVDEGATNARTSANLTSDRVSDLMMPEDEREAVVRSLDEKRRKKIGYPHPPQGGEQTDEPERPAKGIPPEPSREDLEAGPLATPDDAAKSDIA